MEKSIQHDDCCHINNDGDDDEETLFCFLNSLPSTFTAPNEVYNTFRQFSVSIPIPPKCSVWNLPSLPDFLSQSPQLWSQRKWRHCEYICTAAIFHIMISHTIFNLLLLIPFVMSLVCSYLCPSELLYMTFLSSQELRCNASFSISFKVHCLCLTFCPPSCPDLKSKPTLNPFTSHKSLSLLF